MKRNILNTLLIIALVLMLPVAAMANGIRDNMVVALDSDFDKSGDSNYYAGDGPNPYITDSWYTNASDFDLYVGNYAGNSNDPIGGYAVLLIAIPDVPSAADFTSISLTHGGSTTTIGSASVTPPWWYVGTNLLDKGNSSDEVTDGHGVWYKNYYAMFAIGWMDGGGNLQNPGSVETIGVSIDGASDGFMAHFDVFLTSEWDVESDGYVNSYGSVLSVNPASSDTSYVPTIPEPTTALLLSSGMFLIGFMRKRF